MMRFKLQAGMFICPDKTKPKGPNGKRPSTTLRAGAIVESDEDLAAKHPGQFVFLGGERDTASSERLLVVSNPGVAPNGQVSSGFQATTGAATPGQMDRQRELAGQPKRSLEAMSDAELKALAEEREFELNGDEDREELLERLKAG